MTTPLLTLFTAHPPSSTHIPPSTILTLSRHALPFLSSSSSKTDTPETWLLYENLLLTCLRSQDDTSARTCLERLTERFGEKNERVMALKGLYDEATASGTKDLEGILRRYEEILNEDPTNIPIHKRLVSLLTHLSNLPRAISNLTSIISTNPTDAESWAELSHLYFTQSLYVQSLFCLEEIILIYPHAYNIFARMGEVSYILSMTPNPGRDVTEILLDSQRYYLRSIELCEDYLRGYYGLVLVTGRLLEVGKFDGGKVSREKVERLRVGAVKRLGGIVGKARRREEGWEGLDIGEVEAAGRLLTELEGKIEK